MFPNTLTLTAGSPTATVTATPRNRSGQVVSGVTVYFVSSNPAIATVNKTTGVVTRVASGTVTITGQLTDPGGTNNPPAQPSLSAGTITTSGATLTGTAFSDPDAGDTQAAAQWQVTTSGDANFLSPVISTGDDATHKTSYAATGLSAGTPYLARVRYKDSFGNYSLWSANAAFTTNTAVTAPTVVAHGKFTQSSRVTGTSGVYGTTGTPLTISGLSSTGALILFLANTGGAITGVTLNTAGGRAFTQIGTLLNAGRSGQMDVWYLLAPPDGSANAYIQVGGGASSYGTNVLVALDHVDQTTPIEGTGTGTNSATVTGGSALSLALAGCGWQFDATETAPGAPATELEHNQDAFANMAVASAPGGASVTIAWTGGAGAVTRAISVKGA